MEEIVKPLQIVFLNHLPFMSQPPLALGYYNLFLYFLSIHQISPEWVFHQTLKSFYYVRLYEPLANVLAHCVLQRPDLLNESFSVNQEMTATTNAYGMFL